MRDDILSALSVALGIAVFFCGVALCIHVFGMHWAKPELQKHYRVEATE